jgi:hypothetical protein
MSVGFVWIVILQPTLAVLFVDFARETLSKDMMQKEVVVILAPIVELKCIKPIQSILDLIALAQVVVLNILPNQ